ncbi:MAG: hypothetical protein LHW56_01665 [Candidatus Cloacimonetes bacterium]|nr:hypothetical protein [Candidatus Cloacimonadota bacterium]MDY0171595.1 hypothetical protein [Candidatus Cloacimonadaceae bacterium]
MALISYTRDPELYGYSDRYMKEALERGATTRNFLSALGDYWTEYFKDRESLQRVLSGSFELLATQYNSLLGRVLCSSLITAPIHLPIKHRLLVFDRTQATYVSDPGTGELLYLDYPLKGMEDLSYLVSSLFEPNVALQQGVHFSLEDETLRFYVDIFTDPVIIEGAYSVEMPSSQYVLFWATNVLLIESYLYERFGHFLYQQEVNSLEYKLLLEALQFFFVNAKSVTNIESILNILYGFPYARYAGEVVQAINPRITFLESGDIDPSSYYEVVTDHNTYQVFFYGELLVEVGTPLQKYQLIARWNRVNDYISNPDWYNDVMLPKDLVEDFRHPDHLLDPKPFYLARNGGSSTEQYLYDLMDQVLKYNLVYISAQINDHTATNTRNRLLNLYEIIREGFPVYLYPLIDMFMRITYAEVGPKSQEDSTFTLGMAPSGDLSYRISMGKYHNGQHYRFGTITRQPASVDTATMSVFNTDNEELEAQSF